MGQSATSLDPVAERRNGKPSPLRRRILFAVAAVVIGCLLAEFAAFVIYGLIDGRPFSYSRVQAERNETANAAKAPSQDGGAAPEFLRSKTLHPYLGYVATPSLDAEASKANGEIPTHFGFYDGNPILTRSKDTVIIAIVGGSVAYGFGVPASDGAPSGIQELESRLAASPRFAGKKLVFLRLALSGYKQPQQLMTIGYLLSLGAEFDMVINIDGFNEVALHPSENGETGTFAAFPRMWSFQTAGRRQDAVRLQLLDERRQELARTFSCPVLRNSVTANLIWKLRDRRLSKESYDFQQSLVKSGSPTANYESTGPARRYADENEMMNDLVAIWKRSSLQLDRLCRANGIAYYHILQPNQYVADSKPLTATEQSEAYDLNHPYKHGAELGYPLLISAGGELQQQGVNFVDLSRVFADIDETLYIDSCCHFNDKGYTILADAIAEAILSSTH